MLKSFFLLIGMTTFVLFSKAQDAVGVLTKDSINILDASGKKQGKWIKKYDNEVVRYIGQFKDDKPYGKFQYFTETGELKTLTLYSSGGDSTFTSHYNKSGVIIAKGYYFQQQKTGTWLYYNDEKMLLAEEVYKNGVKDGLWKVYFRNGNVSETVTWKDGKREGEFVQYHENGKEKLRTAFKNDEINGKFEVMNSLGIVVITGVYENSLKKGDWLYFDNDGIPSKKETYVNGLLKKSIDLVSTENKEKK